MGFWNTNLMSRFQPQAQQAQQQIDPGMAVNRLPGNIDPRQAAILIGRNPNPSAQGIAGVLGQEMGNLPGSWTGANPPQPFGPGSGSGFKRLPGMFSGWKMPPSFPWSPQQAGPQVQPPGGEQWQPLQAPPPMPQAAPSNGGYTRLSPGMYQGPNGQVIRSATMPRAGGYNAQGAAPGAFKRAGGRAVSGSSMAGTGPNMAYARQNARRV